MRKTIDRLDIGPGFLAHLRPFFEIYESRKYFLGFWDTPLFVEEDSFLEEKIRILSKDLLIHIFDQHLRCITITEKSSCLYGERYQHQ